ncbi:hypothetical protein SAMN05444521_1989 [Streptomyces sp. 3214.6]|nr:hypothetical protein SAMN05444521_1989 [Streptomyces sp. 3214.6]
MASAVMTPPPATISGRSAAFSIRIAFSTCARVAAGLYTGSGSYVSGSNSISVCWTSTGRSIRTGPGRPERMRWKACWKTPGTWAASRTVTAIFVTGPAMEAMSTAWKSSLWSTPVGACPVMHRMGIESPRAEYSPVIMSVPAGPEVPTQTPMLPARARV